MVRLLIDVVISSAVELCLWEPFQRHHNKCHGVWNNRRLDCMLNRLFRRKSKKTPELRTTGLCGGNPPVIGGFPSQRTSNAANSSIWWCHHYLHVFLYTLDSCKFGENCDYPCHCQNNEVCNPTDGSCPTGCGDGDLREQGDHWYTGAWSGYGCQIGTCWEFEMEYLMRVDYLVIIWWQLSV